MHSKNVLCLFVSLVSFFIFARAGHTEVEPQLIQKKALVIATGLPGAGKTTYLKELSRVILNSVYLDKDVITETFLGPHVYFSDFYNQNVRDQSYQLMLRLAEDNLKSNRVVLLDGYFGNKLFSPLLQKYIVSDNLLSQHQEQLPVHPYVVYFSCSDAKKHHERILTRGSARDSDKINDKFDGFRKNELKVHDETLETLNKKYQHVPFLRIQTDSDSLESKERNIRTIVKFLENQ